VVVLLEGPRRTAISRSSPHARLPKPPGKQRPPGIVPHAGLERSREETEVMAEINHVVAHFNDGSLLKGSTEDFSANRPAFHMHEAGSNNTVVIQVRKLKAVFFVRDLNGNPDRRDIPGFIHGPGETNQGKKIAVRFRDKEIIFGYTLSYSRERSGFFLTPADPGSNNLRVYILTAATVEVKMGEHADKLALEIVEPEAA